MPVGEVLQPRADWNHGALRGRQVHSDEHPGWVQVRRVRMGLVQVRHVGGNCYIAVLHYCTEIGNHGLSLIWESGQDAGRLYWIKQSLITHIRCKYHSFTVCFYVCVTERRGWRVRSWWTGGRGICVASGRCLVTSCRTTCCCQTSPRGRPWWWGHLAC